MSDQTPVFFYTLPQTYTIYKSACERHKGYKLIMTEEGLIMARCVDCGHLLTKQEVEGVLNGQG